MQPPQSAGATPTPGNVPGDNKSAWVGTPTEFGAASFNRRNPPPGGPAAPPTNPDNNLLTAGSSEQFYGDTKDQYKTPSAAENTNSQYGGDLFNTPSYTEQLVQQGMGGQLNDYYEFAANRLNDQFAAMGGANSGALMRGVQGLRAQQSHDMMDFTQAADSQRLGRYGMGENFATNADVGRMGRLGAGQGAAGMADASKRGRLGLVANTALGIGTGEANTTNDFYRNASAFSNPYNQEDINAAITRSTIDPNQALFHDAMAGIAAYGKGRGVGGAGGGGGGYYPPSGADDIYRPY